MSEMKVIQEGNTLIVENRLVLQSVIEAEKR